MTKYKLKTKDDYTHINITEFSPWMFNNNFMLCIFEDDTILLINNDEIKHIEEHQK